MDIQKLFLAVVRNRAVVRILTEARTFQISRRGIFELFYTPYIGGVWVTEERLWITEIESSGFLEQQQIESIRLWTDEDEDNSSRIVTEEELNSELHIL